MTDQLVTDQIAYYRARAAEYDEWFLRQGRYDRGPEHRREWFAEVESIRAALCAHTPFGSVLEPGVRHGTVDGAQRISAPHVRYVTADIFSWTTEETFDLIFFSFWLSHVPIARFEPFWSSLRSLLRPHGRVFFVDSLLEQESTAKDHGQLDRSGIVRRRLNDGREFDIVKVFHDPTALTDRLQSLGWRAEVHASGRFFLYGSAT